MAQTPIFPKDLRHDIDRLARHDCPVIVTGETGSGKEVVVRELHRRSARHRKPFVAVNCAALPAGLLESELFGHARGAFTGAIADAPGKVRLAQHGTLLLDEIGELDDQGQAKLLRVIETKEVCAVGARRGEPCDVRFVAATHRDVFDAVDGRLREDLFYRLCVGHLHVPPLRERPERLRALIDVFVEEQNVKTGRRSRGFDRAAMALLERHRWPGNIRELRNLVEATFVNSDAERFGIDDIPALHRLRLGREPEEELYDAARLTTALRESGGNKSRAARALNCSRTTVYRRLRKLEREAIRPSG